MKLPLRKSFVIVGSLFCFALFLNNTYTKPVHGMHIIYVPLTVGFIWTSSTFS